MVRNLWPLVILALTVCLPWEQASAESQPEFSNVTVEAPTSFRPR
jgi:hypothetical protein